MLAPCSEVAARRCALRSPLLTGEWWLRAHKPPSHQGTRSQLPGSAGPEEKRNKKGNKEGKTRPERWWTAQGLLFAGRWHTSAHTIPRTIAGSLPGQQSSSSPRPTGCSRPQPSCASKYTFHKCHRLSGTHKLIKTTPENYISKDPSKSRTRMLWKCYWAAKYPASNYLVNSTSLLYIYIFYFFFTSSYECTQGITKPAMDTIATVIAKKREWFLSARQRDIQQSFGKTPASHGYYP